MDSLALVNLVSTGSDIGGSFIPAPFNLFAPLITFLVTTLCGWIIHKIRERARRKLAKANK